MIKILAISGSLRQVSSNTALLKAAIALAPPNIEIKLYSGLNDLPHFNPDLEPTDALLGKNLDADGIIADPVLSVTLQTAIVAFAKTINPQWNMP